MIRKNKIFVHVVLYVHNYKIRHRDREWKMFPTYHQNLRAEIKSPYTIGYL